MFRFFSSQDNSDVVASTQFEVEALESRMMLSTVVVSASGQMGVENMRVLVGDEVIIDVVVPTDGDVFSADVDRTIDPSEVRIEFTNDLYSPDQGIDRNLFVDALIVDAQAQDLDSKSLFSSGTWLAADGVTPGLGRGSTLHANGYLRFEESSSNTTIDFAGNTWNASQPFNGDQVYVDPATGELVISGNAGAISVSRQIEFTPGQSVFSVEAYRDVIAGSFTSDSSPWATAGINFYNAKGELVTQRQIEVNSGFTSPTGDNVQSEQDAFGDEITSAYVWVWINEFENGTDIPIRVKNIDLQPADTTGDVTPPTARLTLFSVNEPTGEEINFLITFTDDQRLADNGGGITSDGIRVVGSNGFEGIAVQRTGQAGNTDQSAGIIYGLLKPDGSDWGPEDFGQYTVTMADNALVDAAGNVAPAAFLGQFVVDIDLGPADTEPPIATVDPIADITTSPRDGVQIVVYTTDNRTPFPFAREIRVVSDNGFDELLGGTAGGFDATNNRNWELFIPRRAGQWSSADNGVYTILLPADRLVDAAGNAAPAQVLGTFIVAISDDVGVA